MVARQDPSIDRPQAPNGVPQDQPSTVSTQELLRAAAELSRKLQWAIGTTWWNTTGNRASKKQVDYLATRLAADIIDQLHQTHTKNTVKGP